MRQGLDAEISVTCSPCEDLKALRETERGMRNYSDRENDKRNISILDATFVIGAETNQLNPPALFAIRT